MYRILNNNTHLKHTFTFVKLNNCNTSIYVAILFILNLETLDYKPNLNIISQFFLPQKMLNVNEDAEKMEVNRNGKSLMYFQNDGFTVSAEVINCDGLFMTIHT